MAAVTRRTFSLRWSDGRGRLSAGSRVHRRHSSRLRPRAGSLVPDFRGRWGEKLTVHLFFERTSSVETGASSLTNPGSVQVVGEDRLSVASLKLGEQHGALPGRAGQTHDPSSPFALALARGRSGVKPGREFLLGEGVRVSPVGVEHGQQRRPAMDDSDSGVGVTVDVALVAFGETERPLQIQVVHGQVGLVAAREQAGAERGHRSGHVLVDRVRALAQTRAEREEPIQSLGTWAGRRVQSVREVLEPLHVPGHGGQLVVDGRRAPLDAGGEVRQGAFAGPPFFSPWTRPMESRTSPRAEAIRTPGGRNGPPWSSLRMPRTAAQ